MVKYKPDGYSTLTPYLTAENADTEIQFLRTVFGAELLSETRRPDGTIWHADMRIGDSRIMLGQANATWKVAPLTLYVYVENADETYKRALENGATSITEMATQFYGDRSGGFRDSSGNMWWVATHVEDVSEEEMKRRADEFSAKQSATSA